MWVLRDTGTFVKVHKERLKSGRIRVFMVVCWWVKCRGKMWQAEEREQRVLTRDTPQGHIPPAALCPRDKGALFFWALGGHLFFSLAEASYDLPQWKVRESFLHLPFLKFLLLKIFTVPKCHVLEWFVQKPSTCFMAENGEHEGGDGRRKRNNLSFTCSCPNRCEVSRLREFSCSVMRFLETQGARVRCRPYFIRDFGRDFLDYLINWMEKDRQDDGVKGGLKCMWAILPRGAAVALFPGRHFHETLSDGLEGTLSSIAWTLCPSPDSSSQHPNPNLPTIEF